MTTITIPDEPKTEINSAQQSTETQAVQTAASLTQAENYGAMKEAFNRSETEAAQIRLELASIREMLQSNQTMTQSELTALQEKYNKLIQALEEDNEENATQTPESLNGATVVTPPPIVIPTQTETKPKKTQSRWNRVLFGKDDEEE